MLSKTNIEEELKLQRLKRISPENIGAQVQEIFTINDRHRSSIKQKLTTEHVSDVHAEMNFDLLESARIYHKDDIRDTCVDFRLRFLDARYFKGGFPEEAISEIRNLENKHQTSLKNFKIMAPAKLLKLENADDPLLFVSLGNDYYYLVHKWGNDLHPLRKWLMWPYRNFENLIFTVFILSLVLTVIWPMEIFTKGTPNLSEYLLLFLFMFKAVGGVVLFYGFAKGKNFNEVIWDSKYYNA
jgi:hypothetical protein